MAESPRALLQKYFGFGEFRPGQEAVIDALLAGRSALAVFPTGGGKSLCYQLPALAMDGVTLVVSPLIALMKDQIDFLTARGVPAARLDSTLTWQEARDIGDKLTAGDIKLLYVAPERFNNERFLNQLGRLKISLLAIDEAHCISEWGHNFRPDYLKLAEIAKSIGAERVLALTATATPLVAENIRESFAIAPEDVTVTGFYRPNLSLATTPVSADKRDDLLLARLQKRKPGPTIIYVTLQKTAERVAELLTASGVKASAYHAGMDNDERARVQEEWMASEAGVVVATIAFGMGIDKADVRYVYHYNLPKSLESYSQEIGRAGRDGKPSVVELLACPDDVPTLENFAYGDTPTGPALRGVLEDLLGRGPSFDLNVLNFGNGYDIRPLVMRTILTYLELLGVLKQGTPFFAGYEFRPRPEQTPDTIAAGFPGPAGTFVKQIFEAATKARVWYSLDPDVVATTLSVDRQRVVRALEVMQERELIELRTADVRNRYTRLREEEDIVALGRELMKRFASREAGEMARIRQVLELVTHEGCQVNFLVGYFGEERDAPCGHCAYCQTGKARVLPPVTPPAPLPGTLLTDIAALRDAHPDALGQPRQVARFLCGLTSPALTRAKLGRHPLFGTLEDHPFAEIMALFKPSSSAPA